MLRAVGSRRSRFSGGVAGGGSDEPDMSSVGTLLASYNAADMAHYADIVDMGNDGGGSFHFLPVPCPILNPDTVHTDETVLVAGELVAGKIPKMMWPGTDQESATFETIPENFGNSVAIGWTHFFQCYAKMTLGGTGEWVIPGHIHGINVKFMEFWWHLNTTGGRTQTNTRYPIGSNTDTAPTVWELLDSQEISDSTGHPGCSDSQQPTGPRPQEVFNAQWHRFTWAIRAGSSTDKYQRFWIDGVKVIDVSQATIDVVPPGGHKPWCKPDEFANLTENDTVSKVLMGSVQTNAPDHSQDTNPWDMRVDKFLWRVRAAA